MRIFPGLEGNENLKSRLGAIFASGRSPSHAYVAEGPDGSGKHTFALQFAAALSCENASGDVLPCGKCLACRKILSGISPDVITVGPEDKASLGVEKIRDLRRDVHIYPNELEHKIYIIEQADTMTVQAQNAFLLTLEEPPEYAVFILLCRNSGSLLETVRSRAPVLRMQPLSAEDVRKVVTERLPDAARIASTDKEGFDSAIMASGGAAGKAIELLGGRDGAEVIKQRAEVCAFISLCADRRQSAGAMNELIKDCANSRDTASGFLRTCTGALRDLILLSREPECELRFFPDREKASELADSFTLRKLLSIYDAAEAAISSLSGGLNVRLTLMTMLSDAGII